MKVDIPPMQDMDKVGNNAIGDNQSSIWVIHPSYYILPCNNTQIITCV